MFSILLDFSFKAYPLKQQEQVVDYNSLHLTPNNTNDSFNDLYDPFSPGRKNISTKLFDEQQASSVPR